MAPTDFEFYVANWSLLRLIDDKSLTTPPRTGMYGSHEGAGRNQESDDD
jgi:hypothetical protein